nr:odorant binding protein 17 [Pachyrhinus yasumatsui]
MFYIWIVKTFGIFSILCFVHESKASTDGTKLNAFLKTCQEKTGASNKDYDLIKMRKIPLTKEGICMVECIFTQFHIIENGQFNRHGFVLTFSTAMKGDFKKISKLNDVAAICETELGTEPKKECDATRQILACLARNQDKLNISKKA